MIENISNSLIDWSSEQFSMNAMYLWIFFTLTFGLGISLLPRWPLRALSPFSWRQPSLQ